MQWIKGRESSGKATNGAMDVQLMWCLWLKVFIPADSREDCSACFPPDWVSWCLPCSRPDHWVLSQAFCTQMIGPLGVLCRSLWQRLVSKWATPHSQTNLVEGGISSSHAGTWTHTSFFSVFWELVLLPHSSSGHSSPLNAPELCAWILGVGTRPVALSSVPSGLSTGCCWGQCFNSTGKALRLGSGGNAASMLLQKQPGRGFGRGWQMKVHRSDAP